MLDEQKVKDFIIHSFEEWKMIFRDTKSYDNLCDAFIKFIRTKTEDDKEALKIAYSNFNHMCETDPEGKKEKIVYENRLESVKKDAHYENLYKQHKKQTYS